MVFKYADLFCGIGGFHIAAFNAAVSLGHHAVCVFASDYDEHCQIAYKHNHRMAPEGDICQIEASAIHTHDILFAGFPCQPFSVAGNQRGFDDVRGTAFFEIVRVLEAKRPKAFMLENVSRLRTHDDGKTFNTIVRHLGRLGYYVGWNMLNALDYGLPQLRRRILIVGFQSPEAAEAFTWDVEPTPMTPLSAILEQNVDPSYTASEATRASRSLQQQKDPWPTIWHQSMSGQVSKHPYSCALRANASSNYLLVDGERRLTEREMLRLQGFPDSFELVVPNAQTRKQAGNAIPIPMVQRQIVRLMKALTETKK